MPDAALQMVESYLDNIVVAIVILLAGLALGVLIRKLLYRFFREVGLNRLMLKSGWSMDLETGISNFLSYAIYITAIYIFLDQLGIRSLVIYIIAGALVVLFFLTFLVGIRDVFPNLRGWMSLKGERKIKLGKEIRVGGIKGVVKRTGLLETQIMTEGGDLLHVPNSLFLKP